MRMKNSIKMNQMKITPIIIVALFVILFSPEVYGQALDFDGVNDYASASGVVPENSKFTIEAWVKPRNFSDYNWVIQIGDVGLGASSNGYLTYMVDGSTSGSQSTQSIPTGSWNYIALVYNSSLTNKYTLYFNGAALAITPQFSYAGKSPNILSGFYFSRNSGGEGWIGGIDEVRIWSIARTSDQISANYNIELANPTGQADLAGYYKLNEGTPGGTNTGITSLIDASGNNHPATLSGFALTGSTSNYISGQLSASCTNPTNGGTIGSVQTICSGITPAELTQTVAPAGTVAGSLQYKWQISTTSAAAGFADISGATSSTYQPGALTQTIWYKRLVKVDCESSWLESNVLQITVNPVPTIAAAGSDQTVCASSATLAGNTATAGTGTWTKTSGTASISDPSSPTSGLTGISGTAIVRWTIATASCGSSFDEVSITSSLPANQTVTASGPICTGNSATVTVGSSQSGVNYTLRDNSNNTVIAGPTAGTEAALNFSTGVLTADKAYNVLATVSKGALAFTGNSGRKKVSLGTTLWTNNFQGTNKATVEAWIYRTESGSLHTIVGNYEGTYPILFRIDGDKITFWVNTSSMVAGATNLAINTWYHVAGTYDGTNLKVYVNGVLDRTLAYTGNFISTAYELKIGGGLSNNTEYFPGSISDVRLWSVARTAAEISASYNIELIGNESGLVALYKMGEGAGSTLGNSVTGNLYPGTLVNSPAWVAGPSTTACSLQMTNTPTVTVTPNNTASGASSNPTLCKGTALTAISHTTTGATGIGAATGLPAGVTASFASNTITIIGTPTASGTFNYSIPLTGGCGNVNATGTITVNPPSFVPAVRHVSELIATGENIKWYHDESGGTALATTVELENGHHYYASQTVNSVESTARLDVTVTVDSTPCAPVGMATQTYSIGATIASLQATGSGIRWYTTATGGSALASSTALVNGSHYYATQTISCTESATRLDVTANVTP